MELIYFLVCMIQPILLPTPEAVTVLAASMMIGSQKAFIIGMIGSVIGISIMYYLAKIYGDKIVKKFAATGQLEKYLKYIRKNQLVVTGLLFIIPILPDEIVCIGAGITGIAFRTFLGMAILCKGITIFVYAYSLQIAEYCSLESFEIILIQMSVLMLLWICSKGIKSKC